MISIDKDKVLKLIVEFNHEIDEQVMRITEKLNDLLNEITNQQQLRYIHRLLTKGRTLLTLPLAEIDDFKNEFDSILTIVPNNRSHRAFKNRILSALGYTDLRSDFYPSYFRKLGIKTCVYCNAQLCVTVARSNNDLIARFQVDHFVAKNKYPCLSIALFNLYPVCASCNNIKGIRIAPFKLYADGNSASAYSFVLRDAAKTLANYITNRDPGEIKVDFTEPVPVAGAHSMNEIFSIAGIYDTQTDIVEELMLKAHIYNKTFQEELHNKFPHLFPNKDMLHQLIVGNYIRSDDIHNRPLAKFTQDIAAQLQLI